MATLSRITSRGASLADQLADISSAQGQKINILDTPGYVEFIGETFSGLRAADAAVLVMSAPAGVEVGTKQMWRRVRESGMPASSISTKWTGRTLTSLSSSPKAKERLGKECVALNLLVDGGSQFKDVIGL